jgi:hypothetical protein
MILMAHRLLIACGKHVLWTMWLDVQDEVTNTMRSRIQMYSPCEEIAHEKLSICLDQVVWIRAFDRLNDF